SLDWGRVNFFLGEVFRNFTRNAGMQATAIGTVTVTIILLGVFLYVRGMVAHVGAEIFNQIEISTYLTPNITPARTEALRTKLAQDQRILSVQFISKKDGLRELRSRMKGQIDTSILTENPLPDKMRIRVRAPEEVSSVARYVKSLPGVATVNYGQDIVTRLLVLAKVMRSVGIAVIALFILVASIIISNTIRLTVFARRREISIMQLVGATNMYIRAPFICEGFLDGLFGTLLAVILLGVARVEIVPKIMAALPFVQLNAGAVDLGRLTLELFIVGGAVGIVASWISVGRYLRT
ncbi:MAG: permease-like cell division protein FtsX, partial [Candidatus Baltobacteraceae bacterium]